MKKYIITGLIVLIVIIGIIVIKINDNNSDTDGLTNVKVAEPTLT